MKTYINEVGLLAFTIEGVDYISNKGDTIELPETNNYIQNLLAKGYISESTQPIKTKK